MNNKLLLVLSFSLFAHLALIVLFPLFEKESVVVIEKTFDSSEAENDKESFEKNLKSFQKKEKVLNQQLSEKDTLLMVRNLELKHLRNAVFSIISDPNWESSEPEVKLIMCDSLEERLVKLLATQELSDSLQHEIISTYKAITENQKSQIGLLKKQNEKLSEHLQNCSADSEKFERELKKQERKTKRAAFLNKVSGTAAVVLTVVAAVLISGKK